MSIPYSKLTDRQRLAARTLASGLTMVQTSSALAIPYRTLQRWANQSELFQRELLEERKRVKEESLSLLEGQAINAARVIVAAMMSPSVTTTQLRAAQDVLDRVHGKAIVRVGGTEEELPAIRYTFVHPKAQRDK